MEITVNTSNKEDVKKAIDILKKILEEPLQEMSFNEPVAIPSLDILDNKENTPVETHSLNKMIDESKEEEDELHFDKGVIPY